MTVKGFIILVFTNLVFVGLGFFLGRDYMIRQYQERIEECELELERLIIKPVGVIYN